MTKQSQARAWLQGFYLAAPMAIERAPTAPLPAAAGLRAQQGSVRVQQLADYPVRSLVFEAGGSLKEVRPAAAMPAVSCREPPAPQLGPHA